MPGKRMDEENRPAAFRLPVALLNRIDAYAARLQAASPGLNVSRSDALRMLLTQALDRLDAAEAGAPPKAKRTRKASRKMKATAAAPDGSVKAAA